MFAFKPNRPAAMLSAAALIAIAISAGAASSASARYHPAGGVYVDVGPLLGNSGEPTASWVAHTLPGDIAAALAASGQAGTPVSVRIDYVLLGPNSGGVGPAGSSPDQMIGTVTVGGVERPLRATSYYYPSASDASQIEQSNFNRVSRLSQAFASWIGRGY
jgi:hypothetical protein